MENKCPQVVNDFHSCLVARLDAKKACHAASLSYWNLESLLSNEKRYERAHTYRGMKACAEVAPGVLVRIASDTAFL